jgi:hypothetical protein
MRTLAVPGSDTTAPSLSEERPENGETDVPVRSVVAFEFNESMDTNAVVSGSINWSNLDPRNMTYRWSPDARTLFCIYNTGLPPATGIGWVLNPSIGSQEIKDVAQNPLPNDISGMFMTSPADPGEVPDVESVLLLKALLYYQDDNSGSVDSEMRVAALEIDQAGINTVLSSEILTPTGGSLRIMNDSDYGTFAVDREYAAQADLDAFFPNGSYIIGLDTARDGIQVMPLTFPADDYPTPPSIVNFEAAQAIDSSQSFTLQWTPFAGGTTDDLVLLMIEDSFGRPVVQSPEEGEPGALNGTSAPMFEIPAGTLSSRRTYECELIFARPVAINDASYPGVTGIAAFVTVLEFDIKTSGIPVPPQLTVVGADVGSFQFLLTGEHERAYAIDASTDGIFWRSIDVRITFGGSQFLEDYDAPNYSHRLYRAREFNREEGVQIWGTVRNELEFAPVSGAVVSTSLDGQTAITDANGDFILAAQAEGDFSGVPYTVTVTADGFEPWTETRDWGNFPLYEFFILTPRP